ncbi:MAG: PAS domain S-box protein [Balneola sp.]
MRKIDSQILELIKSCSKDEISESKLKELMSELLSKYETTKHHLSLLESAIKNDYDSILITELNLENPGPEIVYVNDGFTKMTGYSRDEAIGKTPRILQGEKTGRHVLYRLKKRLIDGQAFFGHTVNYKKDGTEFVNQWDIHPLTNKEGEVTHWVSYQRDITERHELSKVLFDTSIDFEELEENSKRTFVDLDVQGNIISSNKSFREILKLDVDELKEVKIWDLVNDSDRDEVKNLFQEFDSSINVDDRFTWEFKSEREEKLILEADVRWFVSSDQTIVRIHFDNVSLRNRVIETLKKKTGNLEDLLESHDEFVLKFKKDEEGEIYCSYVSESYRSITGMSQEEILNKGIEAVVPRETANIIKKSLEKAFDGILCSEKCEYVAKNDDKITMIQSFRPIKNNDKVEAVKSVALMELKI